MAFVADAPLTPPPRTPDHAAKAPRADRVACSFFLSRVEEAAVDDVVRQLDRAAQNPRRGTCGLTGVYRCPADPPHADTPWRTRFPDATLLCVCRTEEVALRLQQRCGEVGEVVVTSAGTIAAELGRRAAQRRVLNTFLSREQVSKHVCPTTTSNVDAAVEPARQSHRLFAALLSGQTGLWPSEVLGRAALVGGTAVVVDEVAVAAAYLRHLRCARRRRSPAPAAAAPAARVGRVEAAVRAASPLRTRVAGGRRGRGVARQLEVPPPSPSAASSPAPSSSESYGFEPYTF